MLNHTDNQTRTVLLVAGMHRSATSAVTRMISLLGADLPADLMPPVKENNEAGFWESTKIWHFNSDVLESGGSSWDDWRRFDPDWYASPRAAALRERALEILEKEFGQSTLFVLKDPRICRLLPFWLQILAAFDARVKVAIPLRNPLEVAASLNRRDGFSASKSALLWLRHVLDAEAETRGLARAFVTYEQLLADWRAVASRFSGELDVAWPRSPAAAHEEIDRFLEDRLRHHRFEAADISRQPEIAEWVRSVYGAFEEICRQGESPTLIARLNWIRAEFERACAAFGPVVRHEETLRREAEDRQAAARRQNEELLAALSGLRSRVDAAQAALDVSAAQLAARQTEGARLESVAAERQIQVAELRSALEKQAGRTAELESALARQLLKRLSRLADDLSRPRQSGPGPGNARRRGGHDEGVLDLRTRHPRLFNALAKAGIWQQLAAASGRGGSRWPQPVGLIPIAAEMIWRAAARHLPVSALSQEAAARLVVDAGLFEEPWYRQHCPAAAGGERNPLYHWITVGWRQGFSPCPLFDVNWYLSTHPDIAKETNPVVHYLRSGAREGRDPHPLFDTDWYLARNPDVAAGGRNPLVHYLRRGAREGLDPNPLFDSDWYLQRYPEVAEAGINPLAHYVMWGASEGRATHPLFDSGWYLAQNRDVADAAVNPLAHYLLWGAREGRDPHPLFQGGWYLRRYPEVAEAGLNPLLHFLEWGAAEGRDPNPLFDTGWYLTQHPEIAVSRENPLIHYLCLRQAGGNARPHPLFDESWYLSRYPDVARSGVDALGHYLRRGGHEGREPHPLFAGGWYLERYPEVAEAGLNPLLHFLEWGAAEGRDPHPLFDTKWYVAQVPDLPAGVNPLVHYLTRGALQGHDPNPLFESAWYLDHYPNVGQQGQNPLVHYVRWGAAERWRPGPGFNPEWYLEAYPEVAAKGLEPLAHYLHHGKAEGRRCLPPAHPAATREKAADEDPDIAAAARLVAESPRTWEALFPPGAPGDHRVLVVDWKPPTPDRDSGSYRMSKILDCLSAAGVTVDFIGDREAEGPQYAARLVKAGIHVGIGIKAALSLLSRHGMAYGAVLISRPEIFHKYLPVVRAHAVRARVFYDTVDLHWVRAARTDACAGGCNGSVRSDFYKRLELANARSADATLAITEEERSILLAQEPGLDVRVIPNIHDTADHVPPFGARRDLLFIGGFSHLPNIDAVNYFVGEILPLIVRRLPEIRIRIVGSNMPAGIRALASKTVEAIGYLEDVGPCFRGSRVFVAPLRHGAGMKGKVGQSLSLGLPVVTTGIGAEGIGLADSETALIRDDPDGFAAAVCRLYTDEVLWSKLSQAGRALIRQRYSTEVVQRQLLALLGS